MKANFNVINQLVWIGLLAYTTLSCTSVSVRKEKEIQRFNAVKAYADKVLEKGIDRWSGKNTPLLADGINIYTDEPLEYVFDEKSGTNGAQGKSVKYISHNLASQQNLFRMLVGLSNLTGDPKYREAAEKSIRFHFDSLCDKNGLFYWGSSEFIDLRTLKPVGDASNPNLHSHELNGVFPYYDLMWNVDKEKTARFIKAFWNSQLKEWSRLEFDCQGDYNKKMGKLWSNEYNQPKPFFESDGYTSISTGSDLIYAAGILYLLTGEDSALIWSKRLAEQYVKARHPKTNLGASQFSKPKRHKQLPEGPITEKYTSPEYGDRAENQFGNDFPGVALEGWTLFDGAAIYTSPALMQLELGDRLGDKGKEFVDWTLSGLYAYAKYGYNWHDNTFRPMWADGTDLTGYTFKQSGYFGPEGYILKPSKADGLYLLTCTRAVLIGHHTPIWFYFQDKDTCTLRAIWKGLGLGDPGTQRIRDWNFDTENSSPYTLFALLEHHKFWRDQASLRLAEKVADNLLARSFHKGYFLADSTSTVAEFDAIEPLALLALEATLRAEPNKVPSFSGGKNRYGHKNK